MLTNDKGRCDRRTAIQGVKLCEQGSDGRDDCTEVPMMSSNAGHCI